MKRRIFTPALSGLMSIAVLLAGCGGSGGGSNDAMGLETNGVRQSQSYALVDTTGTRFLGGDATSNRYRIVYEPLPEETAQ